MGQIRLAATTHGHAQETERLIGLTDLLVTDGPRGPVLLAATRGDGWLTAFDLATGRAGVLDAWRIDDSRLQLESTDLAVLPRAGTDHLLLAGLAGTQMTGLALSGDGRAGLFGAGAAHAVDGFDMGAVSGMSLIEGGPGAIGLVSLRGGGLNILRFDGEAAISARGVAGDMRRAEASALATIEIGGTIYGFAAYGREDALSSYEIRTSGRAVPVETLTDMPALAGIQALHAVEIAGQTFLIAAGSGTGSVSVLAVDGAGRMALSDQLRDDRNTRFADAAHLDVIEIEGRVFVAAAGSDSGLSLFTLLPGGRLHHLDSVAATLDTPLRGITDIALARVGDGLQIWAATQGAPHLVRFDAGGFDIGVTRLANAAGEALTGGAADDVLVGGEGRDTLSGGSGHDIVMDGAGLDRMSGGAGPDVFILSPDGERDVIADFQPGLDRLDLTGLPGLWDRNAVQVTSASWGAELRYRDEVTEIRAQGGGSLDRDDILAALIAEDRLDLASAEGQMIGAQGIDRFRGGDAPEHYVGGDGNDLLFGEGGDDTLRGGAGQDTLSGGFGEDMLFGDAGRDKITGDAGFDTIHGGDGDDFLNGGGQADEVHGDAGNDRILGEDGYDLLYGGPGDDIVLGGDSPDRLYGGPGDDWLSGGINVGTTVDGLFGEAGNDTLMGDGGFDFLDGGDGDDLLDGGRQADNLYGRAGNDTLLGGDGLDRLFGGADDDLCIGGAGNDGLFGEAGNDTLRSGEGHDRLFGGTGNDLLEGGAGNDRLHGGAGFDTITGGAGNDTITGDFNADCFVFADGHGIDRIDDFEAENPFEKIDLRGVSAIRDMADLSADHLSQSGADAVIDTGGGDRIILTGIAISALDASDFLF